MSRALSRLARVARRLAGASARAGPRLALHGIAVASERLRACEYVADFERMGRHALKRPEWKRRLKLFEIYFLGGTDIPACDLACRRGRRAAGRKTR
jgi:hypothetical protein